MRKREPDEDVGALWFTIGVLGLLAVLGAAALFVLDGMRGLIPW